MARTFRIKMVGVKAFKGEVGKESRKSKIEKGGLLWVEIRFYKI